MLKIDILEKIKRIAELDYQIHNLYKKLINCKVNSKKYNEIIEYITLARNTEDNIYKTLNLTAKEKYFILNCLDPNTSLEQKDKIYSLIDKTKLKKLRETESIDRTENFLSNHIYKDYEEDNFYKNSTAYIKYRLDNYFITLSSNYLNQEIYKHKEREIKQVLKEELYSNVSENRFLENYFLNNRMDKIDSLKNNLVDNLIFFGTHELYVEDVIQEYTKKVITLGVNNLITVSDRYLDNPNYKGISLTDYCYLKAGLLLADGSKEAPKNYYYYYKTIINNDKYSYASKNVELITDAFSNLPHEIEKHAYQKKS